VNVKAPAIGAPLRSPIRWFRRFHFDLDQCEIPPKE
jgi:hypothetical protein